MLRYTIDLKPEGYTAEELKQAGDGGADAIIVVSIMRGGRPPHSGSVSYAIISADSVGYGGGDVPEVPVTEIFQATTMMAHRVSQDEGAPQWQRDLCNELVEKTRDIVAASSSRPNPKAGQP
jgi:hypothetical protein